MGCLKYYDKVEKLTGRLFGLYGTFVAKNPWSMIIIAIVANVLMGIGISRMEIEKDMEVLYTPENNQAMKDRTKVKTLFGDKSITNFFPHSQTGSGNYADIIFEANGNIITENCISEIRRVHDKIVNFTIPDTTNDVPLKYTDICAKRNSQCVITGNVILSSNFEQHIHFGNISYPYFENSFIADVFGNVKVTNGVLKYASLVKLRFYLNEASLTRDKAKKWMESFLKQSEAISTNETKIFFAHSDSLNDEISSNLDDDIVLFILTFIFIILYASLATANWKCVSDKQNLAKSGVLVTIMSIVGSIGLVSSCHVKFVDMVGVMPFLILGIGIDDMFVLLSGLAETYDDNPEMKPEERIKQVMKSSGVGVTITTLTDLIAFFVGASSSFLSVKNFCIYTGTAVLLCYLNYLTFFMGCMTLHKQRIAENKHCCTYKKVNNDAYNKRTLNMCMCSGSKPTKREDVEGPMEKYPHKIISKFVSTKPLKIIIIILFFAFAGISIWGAVQFDQGLDLKLLVPKKSYLYKFNELDRTHFSYNVPISFIMDTKENYSQDATWKVIEILQNNAEMDIAIDSSTSLNWWKDFRMSQFYDNTSEINFTASLRTQFLPSNPHFQNDIVFDKVSGLIKASRFFVFTWSTKDSNEFHEVMPRMRGIAKNTFLNSVSTYSPAFIFFEQYQVILPETLKNLGMTVLAIFVVTSVLLPHPSLIFLISLTLVMVLVGLIGFMYFWELTLSFITMVYIIMSVGFSVDYCAHIGHGFMDSRSSDRHLGARRAIKKTGAPIFNGALSSFIGIFFLVFSESFIFQSFFKIMVLTIIFGVAHSLIFLPNVLSIFGPQFKDETNTTQDEENNFNRICKNKIYSEDKNIKTLFMITKVELLQPPNIAFLYEETKM